MEMPPTEVSGPGRTAQSLFDDMKNAKTPLVVDVLQSQGFYVATTLSHALVVARPNETITDEETGISRVMEGWEAIQRKPWVKLTGAQLQTLQTACRNAREIMAMLEGFAETGVMEDPTSRNVRSALKSKDQELRELRETNQDLMTMVRQMRKDLDALQGDKKPGPQPPAGDKDQDKAPPPEPEKEPTAETARRNVQTPPSEGKKK